MKIITYQIFYFCIWLVYVLFSLQTPLVLRLLAFLSKFSENTVLLIFVVSKNRTKFTGMLAMIKTEYMYYTDRLQLSDWNNFNALERSSFKVSFGNPQVMWRKWSLGKSSTKFVLFFGSTWNPNEHQHRT